MADRLSIFGGNDTVQTVRMETSTGRTWDDFVDGVDYIREELVITRHTMENVISDDYEADVEDINLDIDPDHNIRD